MKLEGIRPFVKHPDYPETFPTQSPLLDLADTALWPVMKLLSREKAHHWHWEILKKLPSFFHENALIIGPDMQAKYGGENPIAAIFGHLGDWQQAVIPTTQEEVAVRFGFSTPEMVAKEIFHLCKLRVPIGEKLAFLQGSKHFYASLVDDNYRAVPIHSLEYMNRKDIPKNVHLF